MKIGRVVKYCVFGFIGVCVIYNPELLPGALCSSAIYGVVHYSVVKKKKSKESQAQQSIQKSNVTSQPVQKLQESETAPVQLAFGGIGFAQHEMARQAQGSEVKAKATPEVVVKPLELPVKDTKKGIEWARQRLARKAQESEDQVAATTEVFVEPVEVFGTDTKKGIEWARSKLCKEVTVYDEPKDSIFSSELDVDLIASMIELKPVAGADGIAYARSLLASDTDECIDEPEPVKYEDGISYARSLLSRDSGVVKEEPNPVCKSEEHEPVGGTFGVTEKDIETCRVVAAFFRAYYSSRYNLV